MGANDFDAALGAMSPELRAYTLQHLPTYLAEADHAARYRHVLTDFRFVKAKLSEFGTQELVDDFKLVDMLPEISGSLLEEVRDALRMSANILSRDARQLPSQLLGRMDRGNSVDVDALLDGASREDGAPWLRPLRPSLAAPGGRHLRTLEGHTEGVNAVLPLFAGSTVVSGSSDGTIKVWDVDQGVVRKTLRTGNDRVIAIAASPSGRHFVSAGSNVVEIWDAESYTLERAFGERLGVVNAVVVTADDAIVCGGNDSSLSVWDLRKGTQICSVRSHTDSIKALAIDDAGVRLVSGSEDGTLKIWDVEDWDEIASLWDGSACVYSVAISPDGRHVAAGTDAQLKVWDLEDGSIIRELDGHDGYPIEALAWTPDGNWVLSGSWDNNVKIWELDTGTELATLGGHADMVNDVAVDREGQYAISASSDGSVRVWSLNEAFSHGGATFHERGVFEVTVLPDGKRAISASLDGTLKLWDLATGSEVATLHGHATPVWTVAVSTDGTLAVSGSGDGSIRIWDLENYVGIGELPGHGTSVRKVVLTPDGSRAVSASYDGSVKLWDVRSGSLLASLDVELQVETCSMTSDGTTVVAGDAQGRVHVLRLEGT